MSRRRNIIGRRKKVTKRRNNRGRRRRAEAERVTQVWEDGAVIQDEGGKERGVEEGGGADGESDVPPVFT